MCTANSLRILLHRSTSLLTDYNGIEIDENLLNLFMDDDTGLEVSLPKFFKVKYVLQATLNACEGTVIECSMQNTCVHTL